MYRNRARTLSKGFQTGQLRTARSAANYAPTVCRQVRKVFRVCDCHLVPSGLILAAAKTTLRSRVVPHDSECLVQAQKVTAEELEVAIQNRDRPLVIDFYATWCGPCLLLAKELEQVRSFVHCLICAPAICHCMQLDAGLCVLAASSQRVCYRCMMSLAMRLGL